MQSVYRAALSSELSAGFGRALFVGQTRTRFVYFIPLFITFGIGRFRLFFNYLNIRKGMLSWVSNRGVNGKQL